MRMGLSAVVFLAGWLAMTVGVDGGWPLFTDDPLPLEYKALQLEGDVRYTRDSGDDFFEVPLAVTYGVAANMDAGIGYGGQFIEQTNGSYDAGSSDVSAGAKWQFLSQDTALIDQAITAGIKFPTADEEQGFGSGEFDYDVTWVAGRDLNEQWRVLFNVGHTWLGDTQDEEFSNVLHYGPALSLQATERLSLGIELVLETPVDQGKTSAGTMLAASYEIAEGFWLDAGIGTHVAGEWPDLISQLGFTWVF